jgi:hypothetical protein
MLTTRPGNRSYSAFSVVTLKSGLPPKIPSPSGKTLWQPTDDALTLFGFRSVLHDKRIAWFGCATANATIAPIADSDALRVPQSIQALLQQISLHPPAVARKFVIDQATVGLAWESAAVLWAKAGRCLFIKPGRID